ncbi:hypothetical protein PMIN03_003528 [Paraphaeosphaeria minitans]|uniref:Uncharacterized protein n=1 Tax=Paraphaeosphaeria minitans TaxID=565426 RepID=A0A9P6GMS7_9PLEO|nr:hypothetical protein PMIN01_03835 [Paraphaeosphaeria minitans]
MPRKRSASRSSNSSSSSSSSNSSTHHARAALEAIQRVYTARSARRGAQISASNPSIATAQESSKPTQYDTLSSVHASSSTTTPPIEHPTAHRTHPNPAPALTENTPLLSTFSPVVSPLFPSTSFSSPGYAPPSEPFPDLEPGPGSPSDSSYEGLDVFGTHRLRRRWDLGASGGGGGGHLWENTRFEAWDGCLLVYFFVMFVLVIVGGGVVLIWALLHQS